VAAGHPLGEPFPPSLIPTSPSSLSPHGVGHEPCHRRPPCQLHRRRMPPRSAAPPLHRRATTGVSPASALPAWRIRRLAVVLYTKTLPPASYHRALGDRATTPPHAWATCGDHAPALPACAQRRGHAGRLRVWTEPSGHGPADLSSRPHVAGLRALHCSRRPDSARHCATGLNRFSIVFIPRK
jgi:hypothetical protein